MISERIEALKHSLKLKNWQRKTFYKCPDKWCGGEQRIIVSVGTNSNDRIIFCPKCNTWSETRRDWNGAISSEQIMGYWKEPDDWVKKNVRYHVQDWDQTIINRHERIKEAEAELAEEQDLSTIELVEDDWYTIVNGDELKT